MPRPELTLVDIDEICVTNINRQLQALIQRFASFWVAGRMALNRKSAPKLILHQNQRLNSDVESVWGTYFMLWKYFEGEQKIGSGISTLSLLQKLHINPINNKDQLIFWKHAMKK